jgi:hypothetical protein
MRMKRRRPGSRLLSQTLGGLDRGGARSLLGYGSTSCQPGWNVGCGSAAVGRQPS